MTFIIQTKKENNERTFDVNLLMNPNAGDQKHWTNYKSGFAVLDEAVAEAKSIIESGGYKAQNVRVVMVAMNFKSKTIVEEIEYVASSNGNSKERKS